ncbi:hypothetical protein D3C87_1806540 [compost metagenome]
MQPIDDVSYFDEFESDQSVIWTDADHDEPVFIEFSYRDRDGVRSRRDISLLAVSVCGGELYFTGHCFDRGGREPSKLIVLRQRYYSMMQSTVRMNS